MINKLNYKSEITDLYNDLSDKILNMSKDELENGIWTLIDNINKNKFSFTSGYKVSYPNNQLIGPLKHNNIFSFKYKSKLFCYMCAFEQDIKNYVGPIIEINEEDLNKNLSESLYRRFKNKSLMCKNVDI